MSLGYSPKFSFIRTEREWRRWAIKNHLVCCLDDPDEEEIWEDIERIYNKPKEFPFAVNWDQDETKYVLIFIPKEAIEKMCNMLDKLKKL